MGWRGFFTVLLLPLLLASCATAPKSRFYALTSTRPLNEASRPLGIRVAIGPLELPEYLDRPQMVTRLEGHRLQMHEFDRWGGRLAEDAARVIADNLNTLLGGTKVSLYPSRVALNLDYRIALQVHRFDGVLGEAVELRVAWAIVDERRTETLQVDQRSYRAPMQGASLGAYVRALSAVLVDLSQDLASAMSTLRERRPAP